MAASQLNMEIQADRLSTFDNWPNRHVQPHDLAACGFFYTKIDDLVKCFTCGVEVGGWRQGDDPFIVHEMRQLDCEFLQNYLLEDFPVPANLANCHHATHNCQFHHKMHRRFALKMKVIQKSLEMLKIIKIERPAHMKFATYESRLQSFKTWPKGLKMKAEKLCEAGFFYTGDSDTATCFHCGKNICDWSKNEDAWVEHAMFSPKCSYVLLNKGIDFIDETFKTRGCPKTKNDMKKLYLPDTLKDVIQIKQIAEPSTSRSPNEAAATKISLAIDTARSKPIGLKVAVGKKKGKGKKGKASKGFMCQRESLNGSKNVDEKNDVDTMILKVSDTEERDGTIPDNLCKICCQDTLGIAILPCGHLIACVKCGSSLEKCTVCFGQCLATVRIYLS